MRFILLALSLLIASNSHAGINESDYIYEDDDQEMISAKEQLKKSKEIGEKLKFRNVQNIRRKGKLSALTTVTNENVYRVGDTSKHNVGAKIGMTPEQVLNTYWGEPDFITKGIDDLGSLEQWSYTYYGTLFFDNGKLASILRMNRCGSSGVKCIESRLK